MANKVSGKVQVGPSKNLAAVLRWSLPKNIRDRVWEDFIERYKSPQHLVLQTVRSINGAVLEQVREPFYGSLVVGEVVTLFLALAGALPFRWAILLALTVSAAMIVRDGYMDRAKRGYVCFLWDAVAATVLLAGLQFVWMPPEARLSSGLQLLAARAVVGGATVSFWRLIFRMPEDPHRRLFDEYRDTVRINSLWVVACEALMYTNLDAVQSHMPGLNTFLAGAPIPVWCAVWRLQSNSIGAVYKKPVLSLREHPVQQELATKSDYLMVPSTTTFLVRCLEILYFVLLAAPLAIAAWRWWTGQDADVYWPQVGANAGSLVILTVFWFEIKRLNLETAKALKEKIKEMEPPHADS